MEKLCITSLIASSLVFFGCAASVVEQKGAELQQFPQAEQLKVKTARTLMLRTETQNKNCDVTTFLQIMSERNPDIQNIIDVHYSQTEMNDKTECSYWGIGVTYEGVETSIAPMASFVKPVKDTTAAQSADTTQVTEVAKEEVKEAPAKEATPTDTLKAITAQAKEEAPAEAPADRVKNETAPVTEAAPADTAKATVETAPTTTQPAAPADSTKK